MPISTKQMDVTPEWAAQVLDTHYSRLEKGKFKQRNIKPFVIAKYASDMINGAWLLNPAPITFDEDENLLDGQHRLEAVRKSAKTVPMMVSYGWPVGKNSTPSVIDVIDTGSARTIQQMLHLHGLSNANNYTSAMRFIARVAWSGHSIGTTYASVKYMLDEMGMKGAIDRVLSVSNHQRDFQARNVGPLAYYYTAHPNKAMAFAEAIFNYQTVKGSAAQTFMNWVKRANRPPTDVYMKAICACLRAWHANTELTYVRLHIESIEWLSNLNPKLREQLRKIVPRNPGNK